MIDYALILTSKYQGCEWTLDGDNYSGLTWLSDTLKPTKKQLDDLWPIVLQEIQNVKNDKLEAKIAILDRLGLTADEAVILLS